MSSVAICIIEFKFAQPDLNYPLFLRTEIDVGFEKYLVMVFENINNPNADMDESALPMSLDLLITSSKVSLGLKQGSSMRSFKNDSQLQKICVNVSSHT